MSRYALTSQAAWDIEQIVQYIAIESHGAALALNDRLVQSFLMLAEFPNSGRARRDLAGDRKILFWPVGNYLILYRPAATGIEILAVLHAARDIPVILHHRDPEH